MAKKFYTLGERTPSGRLPKNVYCTMPKDKYDGMDDPADAICDAYGFCYFGCDVETRETADPSTVKVYFSNIRWDTSD